MAATLDRAPDVEEAGHLRHGEGQRDLIPVEVAYEVVDHAHTIHRELARAWVDPNPGRGRLPPTRRIDPPLLVQLGRALGDRDRPRLLP
eukprot:CAMPEP_0182603030 /NCGR_PEP_ID=MMETSP1324-20130603/92290_1 /TAXON_ID=236786 /ORGANISM="Florenciella sp., Strain RCC1587" /LENGTH=88 /DNA_ID=CAMNT_0024820957 /DNA_START=595 /DNA_END=858 /DNA_ORIENTATION=-